MSEPSWAVLIEELTRRFDRRHWTLTRIEEAADREAARELAKKLAFAHEPVHPTIVRSRRVFWHNDDSWIVLGEGTFLDFHFRVSVVAEVWANAYRDDPTRDRSQRDPRPYVTDELSEDDLFF